MSSGQHSNNYDQTNIDTMERVYGRGFMSAGGSAEVARILQDVEVREKRILDLGCGLAGASVAMASELGAASVVGLDIDAGLLERAQQLVDECTACDRIELVLAPPGELPFADHAFDGVYITAVSCHMADLGAFFSRVYRIVRPGGWIAGSEWLVRAFNEAFQHWDDLLRNRGLHFYFVETARFEQALAASQWRQIQLRDRTDAFTEFARESQQRVLNELKPELLDSLGPSGYSAFLEWTTVRYRGLADGGLLQQHFSARK